MSILELLLIAVGLSMDAFAVAACAGLTMSKVTVKKSLIVGLSFGFFQGIMPLIGWLLATWFADKIIAFDHWIAFVLLCFIGGRMILGSFNKEECSDSNLYDNAETSLRPSKMLSLAVATSIDALAVGVSLAFLRVNIISAVSFIGIVTFFLSMLGVKIGNIFGSKFKSKAELAGGVILVLIGLKILLEHMGVINF
jgi:putative Mn2+ efflux pump MntP